MMRKNRLISAYLIVSLLAISGCGSTETTGQEVIELKEPVSSEVGWLTETVIRRNIYLADIYTASIYPAVEEYVYESRQTFDTYKAMLGDEVEKGDALLVGNTESIDKQIESLSERLLNLQENYQEYKEEAEETIASTSWYKEYYQQILDNLAEQEPDKYITGTDGKQVQNPNYSAWERECAKWEGTYNKNDLDLNTAVEELRQETEIYQLDYAYYTEQLNKLKAQKTQSVVVAGITGEVVGIGMYNQGDSLQPETSLVAVGDMDNISIKCEYIPRRNIIYYAKEVYAFCGGKRYEVIYDDNGDTTCTTFYFADENVDVEVGDYAVIVLENNSREQVIAVRKDAVYVDSTGNYVYVVENENTIQRHVKIGVSDGIYTEIVSGLEEGEEILVSDKVEPTFTQVLEFGTSSKEFTKSGNLSYPVVFYLKNPIEYGTIYFQEYLVDRYQYVEEGQPIATVRVVGDTIELVRMETELQRAKERLADLIAKTDESNAEANAASIERQQESISEKEEELANLKADYSTTEIYAEKSGIVMEITSYNKEDIIKSGSTLLKMADAGYAYLAIEGNDNLRYGDELTIIYTDASRRSVTSEATVVTLGSPGVSSKLDDGIKYARISEDVLDQIVTVLQNQTGRYSMSRIRVSGYNNVMENVLLIPKAAITELDGVAYVNVLQEDGTAIPMSVLIGGNDSENYWVIEGLTEGMTICWE